MDQTLLIIGIAALAVGLGLGFLLGSLKSQGANTRAKDAEAELDAYRKQVTDHFSQTAEHFQALGHQYKSLYEHLAAGADDLCDTPEAGRELSFVPREMLVQQTAGETDETGETDEADETGETDGVDETKESVEADAGSSPDRPQTSAAAAEMEEPRVAADSDEEREDRRIYH